MATKTKVVMIRLGDLVSDANIQVRQVDSATVNTYANAMRAGAEFPPMEADLKSKRVVCGNHRYRAYQRIYGPDEKVPCVLVDFPDEAAMIRRAAEDNARHGKPLDPWDKKCVISRLQSLGDSMEDIAALLGMTPEKVKQWAGLTVIVRGESGERREPVKGSLGHLVGTRMDESDYQGHVEHDMGTSAGRIIAQLVRWLKQDMIDKSNHKTVDRLKELHEALGNFLEDIEA